ncbi:hypothetical protein ElyMa_001269800 [Elysia marginata]|uniref:Uncharacterized protein n=1 Tax=Elysia marginata TaxID=1093978 RepID=A0AAV4ICY2_9GAST|nr:hypothetical protein ElyMa_001269800 [Elysia marginata]
MEKSVLFVLLFIQGHRICEGFDLTFDPSPPAYSTGNQTCGVLRCRDQFQNEMNAQANRSRTLTSLTVSKFRLGEHASNGKQWQFLASVTPGKPILNEISNKMKVTGQLSDGRVSLILQFTEISDCLESQFCCSAIFEDAEGRTSIKTAFVGKAIESLAQAATASTASSNEVGIAASDQGGLSEALVKLADSLTTKVDGIEARLKDSLNALENRVEDKVTELRASINDKSENLDKSMERRVDLLTTRVDTQNNRLGDKITELYDKMVRIFRHSKTSCLKDSGVCGQLASKLGDLDDKLKANTGKLNTCIADVKNQTDSIGPALDQLEAAVDQCTGTEDMRLSGVESGMNSLSGLTRDLIKRVSSFEKSYRSGALVPVDEFSDPLGTGKKEWRLAFRGTAFNNVQVYPAYIYGTGIPVEVE